MGFGPEYNVQSHQESERPGYEIGTHIVATHCYDATVRRFQGDLYMPRLLTCLSLIIFVHSEAESSISRTCCFPVVILHPLAETIFLVERQLRTFGICSFNLQPEQPFLEDL